MTYFPLNKAIQLLLSIPPLCWKQDNFVDYERRTELLFYISLDFFYAGDFQKALKYVGRITAIGKVNKNYCVYKASKLLHILMHYEFDDQDLLDCQIRSYMRIFKKTSKALKK